MALVETRLDLSALTVTQGATKQDELFSLMSFQCDKVAFSLDKST